MRPRELMPLNRTGIALSPELASQLIDAARETVPSKGSAEAIAAIRINQSKDGEPAGSMPPPLPEAGRALATRKQTLILVDKMGERLAFERSSTRLYDALLSKFDAFGTWEGGPERIELEHIRGEELAHFILVRDLIHELGADPTAVTPSANLQGVISSGLAKAITDPRTDLQECLEAVLVAELIDNDGWENLSDLALTIGRDDLAAHFEAALVEERDHLRKVRVWIGTGLSGAATGMIAEPFETRALLREGQLGELMAAASIDVTDYAEKRPPGRSRGKKGAA